MKKISIYFGFTYTESKGFLILCSLILLIQIIPFVYSNFKPNVDIIHHLTKKEVREFVAQNDFKPYSNTDYNHTSSHTKDIQYYDFDPNVISQQEWLNFGFSEKQVHVISNYLSKGGKFHKKEDLQKIYSISPSDYKRLKPYIVIVNHQDYKFEDRKEARYNSPENFVKKENLRVDINTADTTTFKQLYGLGSVLSSRIVKYRNALGGFHSIAQVAEVYGLKAETYSAIQDKLIISNHQVSKINVNTCSKETLSKHPYISYKIAETIINYRNQHGNFSNIESLLAIKTINKDFLLKIEPYLEF